MASSSRRSRSLLILLLSSLVPVVLAVGSETPWYIYGLIPIISGLVGFGTNWVALKMTFYPLEFWPIKIWQPKDQPVGLFGWQGIIPAKAATMASDFTDMMLKELFSIEATLSQTQNLTQKSCILKLRPQRQEIFSRIDPPTMAQRMKPGMTPIIAVVVSELAEEFAPTVWASLPVEVHREVYAAVLEKTDGFIVGLMEEMQRGILKVFDLHHMVMKASEENKQLLVDIFQNVGDEEFGFIERSGFYFGFLFGIPQSVLYYYYDAWWILPVAGFFVGYLTNFLALWVIFNPLDPYETPFGNFQGVFLKRQAVVAKEFSEMVEDKFLQPKVCPPVARTEPLSPPSTPETPGTLGSHLVRANLPSISNPKPNPTHNWNPVWCG